MRLLLYIALLFSLLNNSISLFGSGILEFEKLNSNHGLSSEEVRGIFQDSQGFIWFLTVEGLDRFDGYEILNFSTSREELYFSSLSFESICEDGSANIWLGTAENGLMIYDRRNDIISTFIDFSKGKVIGTRNIRTLLCDKNNNIWIGTEYGLYRYNDEDKSLIFYNLGDPGSSSPAWCIIESMIEDKDGNIWIGTWSQGLYVFEPENEEFLNYNNFNASQATLNENRIKSIYEDKSGNIWIGTWEDGLYQVHLNGPVLVTDRTFVYDDNEDQTIAGDIIYSINQDEMGNLWVGTPYGLTIIENLYSYKPYFKKLSRESYTDVGLSSNEVWKIFKDRSGMMWLGTLEGGVNKVHPAGKAFAGYNIPSVSTQIYSQTVQTFCIDPLDNLLLGVKSLGFGAYDLNSKDYKPYTLINTYQGLPDNINSVSCFYLADTTDLWIGTRYRGLLVYNYSTSEYAVVNEYDPSFTYETVNTLVPAADGSVWAGTDDGLYIISSCIADTACFIVRQIEALQGAHVQSIIQDRSEIMWVGTLENGIFSISNYDRSSTYKQYNTTLGSIPSGRIYSLFETSDGNILAGSANEGLLQYDEESDSFIKLDGHRGQKFDKVFGIAEDENRDLWLTTNLGLVRFSSDETTTRADVFTVTDGMQGNLFVPGAIYAQNNNRIFVGGYYGFNAFFPADVQSNEYMPTTAITDVLINDTIAAYNPWFREEVIFNHRENSISFKFSALSFYKPDKNTYAYMLEGLHEDWQYIDASMRLVRFQELNPGSYVFKVKSSNSSELWNDNPEMYTFKILPAPFKTWWAYTSYAIATLAMIVLIFRHLLKNEKIKRALEIEKIEHAKSEKLNQFKLRFFTNISHEILTPLSIISCSVELIRSRTRKGREEFGIIERNLTQLDKLLHQLLDYRKMESGHLQLMVEKDDIVLFTREVVDNFTPLARKEEIMVKYNSNIDIAEGWFDKDKIYKILDNLLTNAIKYTHTGGLVDVLLNIEDDNGLRNAVVVVSDTGRGIRKEELDAIFTRFYRIEEDSSDTGTGIGLAFTKSLIQLHKGNISVSSEFGKGSVFTVRIPISMNAYKDEEIKNINTSDNSVLLSSDPEPQSLGRYDKLQNLKGSGVSILIVDDNDDFRRILSGYLSAYFRIIEARDGLEAYEKALSAQPDLIISDIMMPHKNGFELCVDLKSNVDTKEIPVVLLTAKAGEESRAFGYSSGADSYISKPVNLKVLESRVKALLLKRKDLKVLYSKDERQEQKFQKSPDHLFIKAVEEYILTEISDPELSVKDISRRLGMSDSMFYRRIKAITRVSPVEFIRRTRLNKAATLLKEGRSNVAETAYYCGFSDQSYFTACFKRQFDTTPTSYMKANKKEKLAY